MCASVAAVSAEITRPLNSGSISRTSPSLIAARTIRGRTSSPPLAIAMYACTTCSGVTATPCPKEVVANCTGDQVTSAEVVSSPALSPGRPESVGCPKPNFSMYS